MLKVTVIIPIYNAESHLTTCLDSVKNQRFQNLEVLLIDDASTDKSVEICQKYVAQDSRFTLLRHETNSGVSAARNTGLDNATGDFLFFLDSDMWIEPGCISRLAKVMVDDKSDMSVCSYILEHNNRNHADSFAYMPVGVWSVSDWIKQCVKVDLDDERLFNKMFKRKLFTGVRFDEANAFAEIAILPEVMDLCMKISTFNRVLIHYKVHNNSKDNAVDKRGLDKLSALDVKRNFYKENYPQFVYFVDRQIVSHCLNLLALRNTYGTTTEFDNALPDILNRLHTLKSKKKVCTSKIRRNVFLALHFPSLFKLLVKPYKR